MSAGGSQQLRMFRTFYRETQAIEEAAARAGITLGEAKLTVEADRREPPGPEAFEPLTPAKKDDDMARGTARKAREPEDRGGGDDGAGGGIAGEYKRPDAAAAFKIYDSEIAPKKAHMNTIKGDLSDPFKRIKDDCHFPRKVLDFITSLEDQEDAKRDHMLLALNLGLQARKLHMPRDLVTIAAGDDGAAIVPTGERKRAQLATVPAPADDSDLAGDFEASADELAAQKDRGKPRPGTPAAVKAALQQPQGTA